MATNPFDTIFRPLNNFMAKEELFTSNPSNFEIHLNENFPQWKKENKIVAKEFVDLVENNTITTLKIIENGLEGYGNLYMLKKYGKLSNREIPVPGQQIEILASMYEKVNTLRFIAYLLSGKKEAFERINGQVKILKYFKVLGFTNSDKENFRLLRNSSSHKLMIKGDKVLLENGSEISIEEIKKLYLKVQELFEYTYCILFYSILNIPKFSLYVIIILSNNWKDFSDKNKDLEIGFNLLYPEKEEEEEEETFPPVFKRIKSGASNFIGKTIGNFISKKLNKGHSDTFTPKPETIQKYYKLLDHSEEEINRVTHLLCSFHNIPLETDFKDVLEPFTKYFLKAKEYMTPIKEGFSNHVEEVKNKNAI